MLAFIIPLGRLPDAGTECLETMRFKKEKCSGVVQRSNCTKFRRETLKSDAVSLDFTSHAP